MSIYKERFDNLLRVLYNIRDTKTRKEFDISTWYHPGDKYCGTSACAIGWCCQDEWFQEQGFKLQEAHPCLSVTPSYVGMSSWKALSVFFSIDEETTEHLFRDCSYDQDPVLVEDVIERVEEFVSTHFKG